MRNKLLSFFIFSVFLTASYGLAAQSQILEQVQQAQSVVESKPAISPFSHLLEESKSQTTLNTQYLTLTANNLRALQKHAETNFWQLEIPSTEDTLKLNLVPSHPIGTGAFVRTPDGTTQPIVGQFFHGILDGDPQSIVSVSLFENEIHASIISSQKSYTLAPYKGQQMYALTEDQEAKPSIDNFCSANTGEIQLTKEDVARSSTKTLDNCVNVYFELDYDVFLEKRSVEGATNYLTAVFNEVNAIFVNEGIKTQISEVFVWNIPSPYLGTSSTLTLNQFQLLRPFFNGDIAHFVDFKTSNGGIAYVDVLCSALPYAYSGAQPTFESFPTYSWTIEVITHEIGHNLGSPHTHDCSWPDGAIDNCVPPSGNCDPGETPTNGGTIMSYCHLTEFGINFNNGFGPLPGDLIRNRISNASCLQPCYIGCAAPSSLLAHNITENSFNLNWAVASNALEYRVEYRPKGTTVWQQKIAPTETVLIDGLTNNTTYEARVVSLCDEQESIFSETVEVLTGSMPTDYCQSKGRSAQNEWIASIAIHDYSNTSGANNGFGDFTQNVVYLPPNEEIPFTFTPGFTSGLLGENTYPEYWRMWIDLNADGDFTDAGELLLDSETATEEIFTGTFTIPSSATSSQTRMRISMKYNNAPDPCEIFSEGEVEDYRVLIENGAINSITTLQQQEIDVYPNPAKSMVYVKAHKRISELRLIDALGKTLTKTTPGGDIQGSLSIQDIPNGAYFIEVIYTDTSQRLARIVIER